MTGGTTQIEFALNELARRMRRVYNRAFLDAGVSAQQAAALLFLDRFGPQTQNELADRMELSKAAIAALLQRMEAAELVVRTQHAHDGRSRIVEASPKARQALANIESLTASLGTRLRAGLSSDERRQVVRALNRMSANLRLVEEERNIN